IEEVEDCWKTHGKTLAVRVASEAAGYSDTNHVYVFSPSANVQVSSPTAGGTRGGSYLLDVVTAAAPGIVSEASRAYHEKRNAVSMNAGFKPKLYGISVSGNVSQEPDYLSLGGQVALTGDFNDKLVTPRIAYGYSHDKIGRNFTPYRIFE